MWKVNQTTNKLTPIYRSTASSDKVDFFIPTTTYTIPLQDHSYRELLIFTFNTSLPIKQEVESRLTKNINILAIYPSESNSLPLKETNLSNLIGEESYVITSNTYLTDKPDSLAVFLEEDKSLDVEFEVVFSNIASSNTILPYINTSLPIKSIEKVSNSSNITKIKASRLKLLKFDSVNKIIVTYRSLLYNKNYKENINLLLNNYVETRYYKIIVIDRSIIPNLEYFNYDKVEYRDKQYKYIYTISEIKDKTFIYDNRYIYLIEKR